MGGGKKRKKKEMVMKWCIPTLLKSSLASMTVVSYFSKKIIQNVVNKIYRSDITSLIMQFLVSEHLLQINSSEW